LKVLILSANIGEGHATAARALKAELEHDPATTVVIADAPEHMGRAIRHQIERGYETQIREHPRSYSLSYTLVMKLPPTRWLAMSLLDLFARRPLHRLIAAERPDVVVSVYPAATVVLGRMRRAGELDCPLYAAITDISGLHFWAHPGVDKHLVVHPESVPTVEKIAGRRSAEVVNPLVRAEFFEAVDKLTARGSFGLPTDRRVVVVSGGGWGVGDLAGAVAATLDVDPECCVVAVSGRSAEAREQLQAAFGGDRRVHVVGYCDRMWDLLGAADLLVHSTGGVTVVEACLAGCPSISYGLPVGHIIHNMRALQAAGRTDMAVTREQLAERLAEHLGSERAAVVGWPTAVGAGGVVAARETRVRPRSAARTAAGRFAARAAVFAAALTFVLSSGTTYSLASHVLPIGPTDHGTSAGRRVGLTISASPAAIAELKRELRRTGAHASFAVPEAPPRGELRLADSGGDSPIVVARRHRALGWLKTRSRAPSLSDGGRREKTYYLFSSDRLPLGQRLLAQTRDAKVVRAARRVPAGYRFGSGELAPGSIVELRLSGSAPADVRAFAVSLASIERSGLSVSTVDSLFEPASVATATKVDDASSTAPASTSANPATVADRAPAAPGRFAPESAAANTIGTVIWVTKTIGAVRVAG
jgi:UDP-N-acetylglucosamine:LPS N-acetylglucosamine transferase